MKIKFIKPMAVAFAALAIVACSEDEGKDNGKVPQWKEDAVRFAAGSTSTKTVYDENDIFQINWESDDRIKVYSNKKPSDGVLNAEYIVTPASAANKNGNISLATDAQLRWADNATHNFIGVYPADNADIKVDAENGTVTLPINRDQRVKLIPDSEKPAKYKDYTYYFKPEMENAYLVAYNSLTPEEAAQNDGKVFLEFKPVMTALEIVVKGREAASNNDDVELHGISIIRKMPQGTSTQAESFVWDAVNCKTANELPNYTVGMSTQKVTTFVGIETGTEDKFIKLKAGETAVFTVFLPPYAVGAWPIQVRAHASGFTEVITKEIFNEIAGSSKRRITLPPFPKVDRKGNNWITPLDDDIFVSQLSIPGTHDAATGDGTTFSIGKTQEKTLDQQFEMGVRFFDLRPAVSSSKDIIITHGYVSTSYNWDQVMERFKYYLNNNPGEFIIVVMRHEDEYPLIQNTTSNWNSIMTSKLQSLQNEGLTVQFRPDLTIGDCRGKILFLSRNKYADTPVGGFVGWSHNVNGAIPTDIYSNEGSGYVNVQDCFSPNEANTNNAGFLPAKWGAIEKLLNESSKFSTDPYLINRWSINHTSGYTKTVDGGAGISSTNGYRNNASYQNVRLANKIASRDWNGSTGIVVMDFVGADQSGIYQVYGATLPQTIINNNYRYVMKRKGE